MKKLTREDLYSLEKYAEIRPEFRARVIDHKKKRNVPIGPHATLYFEDRLTIQYQIQEMLRIERIFDPDGIQEELDVYNPLIPDGSNWKATFMIEYEDPAENKLALTNMIGIEHSVRIKVDDYDPVAPIANEDLGQEAEKKISSVHFLRFDIPLETINAAKEGAVISVAVDHPAYRYQTDVLPESTRASLVGDLKLVRA
ncbi:Hypothetical protein i Rubrerythrin cluster [Olavius algarvensis Delta 1 endosymbiont]|nr:Hypothetical protein i Rubrerythrin cluster [Olavius algarvensis Delta 1 endosymbiont]